MKTGFALSQWASLLRISAREPLLSARTNARLAGRAVSFLAENPDLLRIKSLMDPDMPPPVAGEAALIITSNGEPRFSFALTRKGRGNLSGEEMQALLEDARQGYSSDGAHILVVADEVFVRVRKAFANDPEGDPFHLAAVSLWNCFREGLIEIHPALAEVELAKVIDPEDALARFGPRFGLYPHGRKPTRKLLETPRKLLAAFRAGRAG